MKPLRRAFGLLAVTLVIASAVAVPLGTATAQSDGSTFEDTILRAEQGAVAEIPITVPAGDSVRVVVGSEDVNFLAAATVEDADGDGSVVLELDTDAAGSGDPGEYLRAADGDELGDATQETSELDDDRPLDAGAYDLAVGPRDDPADVATLVIESPGTPADRDDDRPEWEPSERETATDDGDTVLVYEGERIELGSAAGQTVRGETSLEPGTTLTVRMRAAGENPFLQTVETEVSEFGTFSATFDLGDVPAGTSFEITVRGEGATLASATGRVLDCEGDCPTPTEPGPTGAADLDGDELGVASVVEVTRSRTARIPVSFGDADAVTVVVGGPAVNYEVSGTVTDTDGDGRTVVLFRTEAAGFEAPTLAAVEGDPAALDDGSETSLKSLLAPGDYPVRLYRGTAADGDPDAVGTLVVHEAPSAVGTPTPEPAGTPVPTAVTATASESGDGGSIDAVGAIALGGVLSAVGIGVLLGLFRS